MNKKQSRLGQTGETVAGKASTPVVQGGKYGQLGGTLLEALQRAGTERDRAGNRQLFYEQ